MIESQLGFFPAAILFSARQILNFWAYNYLHGHKEGANLSGMQDNVSKTGAADPAICCTNYIELASLTANLLAQPKPTLVSACYVFMKCLKLHPRGIYLPDQYLFWSSILNMYVTFPQLPAPIRQSSHSQHTRTRQAPVGKEIKK